MQKIQELDVNGFSADLKQLHDFFSEATRNGTDWRAYDDGSIKFMIDAYFEKLNLLYQSSKPSPAEQKKESSATHVQVTPPQPEAQSSPKEKKPRKQREPKKAVPVITPEMSVGLVERIPDEIRFLRRYINMEGKLKSKEEIRSFITSLQRAIVERKIRKTSPYAKEIEYIQEKLVNLHKNMSRPIKVQVTSKVLENLRDIISREKVMPSISFIKRYVSLNGKYGVKGRAQVLYNAMTKAIEKGLIKRSDTYFRIFDLMHSNLYLYLNSKTQKTLNIEKAELNGLNGILGCDCLTDESGKDTFTERTDKFKPGEGVMTSDEAKEREYKPVNISQKWQSLMGKFCLPTNFFFYGKGGGGKTSLALLFCQELSDSGYKILYVAGEQYDTPPFKAMLIRLQINLGEDSKLVDSIERLNPKDFDFVVLDTKDSLSIKVEEFVQLDNQYQNQSFIVIPHATKAGTFKGSEQWRNIMDVMVECSDGVARTGHDKNRWGGAGEMRIFEPQQIKKVA